MNTPTVRFLFVAAALAVTGCAQTAKVSAIRPPPPAASAPGDGIAAARSAIAAADGLAKRQPLDALGDYLYAARSAQQQFLSNPRDTAARDAANFALSRAFGVIQDAKIKPWSGEFRVPATGGDIILTHKPDPRPNWNPVFFEFAPADQYKVEGTYVSTHSLRQGLGAPLVAISTKEAVVVRDLLPDHVFFAITGIARFEGARCVIEFHDPLEAETVRVAGRTVPLAADFTTPLAFMLAAEDSRKMSIGRLLKPEEFTDTAQITLLQPYDPDKTVVLMIHGLASEPSTWIPMINTLRADPDIRRNCQIWFYSYPSGWPYPHSAAVLRQELDRVHRNTPLHKPMVVIGHSMGGCISRLLITDSGGEKLWEETVGKPPAELSLSPASRKLFSDALVFQHRPEIGRVIFICAPLRGSDIASNRLGRIGSKLIRAPATLLAAGSEILKSVTFGADDLQLKEIPNSVDTLAPNNRFVKAINTFPPAPGIPYHVICGDRGKGGNKDRTEPVMADGVVPYWSSHMDGAKSELIVPSNHAAQQHPQGIAEVLRILRLHAGR